MKKIFATLITLTMLAGFAVAAHAADVAQGKCMSMDGKTLVIEEYDINKTPENKYYGNPTGIQTTFDVTTSKIGIPPEPGDILRIAYDAKDGKNMAHKVMNVSKQDLSKK